MNLQFEKEEFLSRVYMNIVNASDFKEMVEKCPSVLKGDMALVPRLLLGDRTSSYFSGPSALVTNEMFLELEMSIDDFQERAMTNSKEMFPGRIVDVIKESGISDSENFMLFDNIAVPAVYAVTNSIYDGGMAAVFYDPDTLDNLASMKEKDIIVFPVDGSAAFCVEFNGSEQFEEMQSDYAEICAEMKERGVNVLSDKILHYDRASRTLTTTEGEELSLGAEPEYHAVNRHFGR